MDWMLVTEIVAGSLILIGVLYDGFVIWKTGDKVSISQLVWDVSTKKPLLPFAAGFVAGHLWFH